MATQAALTTQQYLDAVDKMRMAPVERAALKRQIREGNASAKFVVYSWIKRNSR